MDGYNRGSHSVYQLTYHIVFVTKYRKRVITDEMGDFMKNHAEYLWGDSPFWSASYFCATTGSVSMETVKKYIEDQRTEEHKRKYTKSGKYIKQKS